MDHQRKQLIRILSDAAVYFNEVYIRGLPDTVNFKVQRSDGLKTGSIKKAELFKKFETLTGSNPERFKNKFLDHLQAIEAYLAYSSSPIAFAQAWKFRKTKISKLSLFEVQ